MDRKQIPPPIDDIDTYCQERNNDIDAAEFFDYYEARGWMMGRSIKMKDWQAAVRTWERRQKKTQRETESVIDSWRAVNEKLDGKQVVLSEKTKHVVKLMGGMSALGKMSENDFYSFGYARFEKLWKQ